MKEFLVSGRKLEYYWKKHEGVFKEMFFEETPEGNLVRISEWILEKIPKGTLEGSFEPGHPGLKRFLEEFLKQNFGKFPTVSFETFPKKKSVKE